MAVKTPRAARRKQERRTRTPKVKTMDANSWKLQDAKAKFSEVVRRARAGKPQQITVRDKDAVVVLDAEGFEYRPKPPRPPCEATLGDFIERSRKYRGLELDIPKRIKMKNTRPNPFEWERSRTHRAGRCLQRGGGEADVRHDH